ncbi:MAG TPA: YcxB family protein [Candidatus Limnocylindrales bacterium]|nr:YcxB family protein [Candidatus Limnocylindrales bacterium]
MTGRHPMTIHYTMTLDDLVDGNRLVQRTFRRFVTAVGLIVGVLGVMLLVTSPGWLGVAMIGYGLLDLVLVWTRPIERLLMGRRVARLVGNECEVAVAADGLSFADGGVRGEIAWSALTGLREDGRTLAVVSGGVARLGIPKRAFGSEADLAAFRTEVTSRIEAAKERR